MDGAPTMRAAVFHGQGDIRISDVPIPAPGEGELLLRIATVGICGTDVHEFADGPHRFPVGPFIPGHEFAGTIEAIGPGVTDFGMGALVTSGAGLACGECHWCLRGSTNMCQRYVTIGLEVPGGLAQFAVVPANICVDVASYGLIPDVAVLAQPMSIAVHATRRGRLEAGDNAFVVGAGGIGAFITYAAAQSGARVIVLDLDQRRLEVALRLGAARVIEAGPGFDPGQLLGNGGIPTVIYEATGTSTGLDLALAAAQRGTRVVLVGMQGSSSEIELRRITIDEIELIGTNAHAFASDFPEGLRLLASRIGGWADVAPLVIPLDDLVERGIRPIMEGRGRQIKTLIDPWADRPRAAG